MTRTKIKQLIAGASASVVLVLGMAGGIAAASANPNIKDDDGHKVTICHRTNSVSNPYTVNSVDFDAATGALKDNGNGDHTNHTGPVFNPNTTYPTPHNGDQWGDIIPPYTWDEGGHYDGLNWTAEGQAVYNNGECNGVYTPPTGGSGGETPSNPQVLGESTQVTTKPVGSVAAGNGGAKELSPASVVGLTGSLAVLVTGAAFAVKRFVRL